jgi:hypothetical protein
VILIVDVQNNRAGGTWRNRNDNNARRPPAALFCAFTMVLIIGRGKKLKKHKTRGSEISYDVQISHVSVMETSKQAISICWCNAPFLTDEVYKAHEILSKIRHKLIQNIILSVFFLYKKICYISNIALENQKCVINIVKRHRGRSSNYFTCTTCGALCEIRW